MNHAKIGRRTGKHGPKHVPASFVLLCTVPTLLLTVDFILVPTIRALVLSFTDATALSSGGDKFVGLENYRYMFTDETFLQAVGNSFRLMLVVPVFVLSLALVLAFLLVQGKLREKAFYRVVFFFPSIISLTVVGIIWSFVFHPTMGILKSLLDAVGFDALKLGWLGDERTALWCIAVTIVWQSAGYFMVMHIAAMDGISKDVYEAATIDGASMTGKLFCITLPLIKNVIGITYVLSLSGILNLSYILSKVMTGGGPNNASLTLLQYIYKQGMGNGNFGYAMAITVFTLVISVVLSGISQAMMNKDSRTR